MAIIVGQLVGPFEKNKELKSLMGAGEIFKIGINCNIGDHITINGQDIEIGKTGMFELRDTIISSLKFNQDEDVNTSIEYMIR